MAAGRYNFDIVRGVAFSKTMYWKTPQGIAIDNSSYTPRLIARVRLSDTTEVIDAATAPKIQNGGVDGATTITFTAEETSSMDFAFAHYDVYQGSIHFLTGQITLRGTTLNG